jgi:DNA ligase-1
MKAYPFEEKRLLKWKPPFIIQPKFDGVRCRAVPLPNGNYMLLSSEENPIFSVPHINKAFNYLGSDIEFDGELYVHSWSFEQIVSVTSRTKNLHEDAVKMRFYLFDYISDELQAVRLRNIADMDFPVPIIKCPFYLASSLEEVMEIYQILLGEGYEGIIVRNYLTPYERKRSTQIMKFKPKKSDTYRIVGVEEEVSKDGIPKNQLGALVCASGDGNTFNVGSGFTDLQRKNLWNCRTKLVGKEVKVEYQHITPKRKVPRFPVFVEVI